MDDKAYVVYLVEEDNDPDHEWHIEYIGVAMSEGRAQTIMETYNPGNDWVKQSDGTWLWQEENKWGWKRTVTQEICYEALDIL